MAVCPQVSLPEIWAKPIVLQRVKRPRFYREKEMGRMSLPRLIRNRYLTFKSIYIIVLFVLGPKSRRYLFFIVFGADEGQGRGKSDQMQ